MALGEYYKNLYDGYYSEGDSQWRWTGSIGKTDNIISLCADVPHASIIEIGAGEGSILKRLSERGFGDKLYALDISSSGVDVIKSRGIANLAECRVFDGYNVPYDSGSFDIAVMSHVIEHVEDPRKLIYEASRVARHVFIEVPLQDTLRLPMDYDFRNDKLGHINFYSPKTIRRLVQTCRLEVVRQIVVNSSKEIYTYRVGRRGLVKCYLKEFFLRAAPRIAPLFFTYVSAMLCRKPLNAQ